MICDNGMCEHISPREWELIQRFRERNDDAAYRQLYELYKDVIYSIIHKLMQHHQLSHDHDVLNDARSEALLAFIRALREYDPSHGVKFSTFLYQGVWWNVEKFLSKEQRHRVHHVPCSSIADDHDLPLSGGEVDGACDERVMLIYAVQRALRQLTVRERAVVVLLCGMNGAEPLSPAEIAQLLGVTSATVQVYWNRAKRKLRRLLGICVRGSHRKAQFDTLARLYQEMIGNGEVLR